MPGRNFGQYEAGAWFGFPNGRSLPTMKQKLVESLDLLAGSIVLNTGCGAGLVVTYMPRRGLNVTTIQYSHGLSTSRDAGCRSTAL